MQIHFAKKMQIQYDVWFREYDANTLSHAEPTARQCRTHHYSLKASMAHVAICGFHKQLLLLDGAPSTVVAETTKELLCHCLQIEKEIEKDP